MKNVKTSKVGAKYQSQIFQNETEKRETPLKKEISKDEEHNLVRIKTLDNKNNIKELEARIKALEDSSALQRGILNKILKILRG